jgi:hypothetical protein
MKINSFLPAFTRFAAAVLISFMPAGINGQIKYTGNDPGPAVIEKTGRNEIIISNNVLELKLSTNGKKLNISGSVDKESNDRLSLPGLPVFELILDDKSVINSDSFILSGTPSIESVSGTEAETSVAGKQPGKKCSAIFTDQVTGLTLHWEAVLKNGSNYVRQVFRLEGKNTGRIIRMNLLKLPSNGISVNGTVDGSPLIRNNMFFALEYPLSKNSEDGKYITSFFPGVQNTLSTAWGVTPAGQMRRGFLYYVERERIHPYRQVLHWNSWYDISYSGKQLTQEECIDRIKTFGDSLIKKRNTHMDAFLVDDGWDEHTSLWDFHSGFPQGFSNLKKTASLYNTDIGVWLSPFGGYGKEKALRLEYGKKQNPPFETNKSGFSLAGPVYYKRFREVTSKFIKDYDVYMLKFDGVGAGSGADVIYQRDVEAFLKLLQDLLKQKPELYLDLTTGTWPSVYWLKFGDNIWRGGHDTDMEGEGSNRQKWITYRDADVYRNVVSRGPLFPLSALMTCGICIADLGMPSKFEMNDKDIADEIWSFFATGVNLQELYVNPHKLSSSNWDCLALAAKWAKENEELMADIHWAGGNPGKGEIYGYAAWSRGKALLSLRNPSSEEKVFTVEVRKILDLPSGETDNYLFTDAIARRYENKNLTVGSGSTFSVRLKPFELKVMEGTNQGSSSRK